jgi:hypothetical protein
MQPTRPNDQHARAREHDEIQRAVGCGRPLAGFKKATKGREMYELNIDQIRSVSGGSGNASQGNSGQTCVGTPNGGMQCTTINGSTTIVNSYDKDGKLTNSLVCSENRSLNLGIKHPKVAVGAQSDGGTSCKASKPSSGSGQPNDRAPESGALIPYYAA